MTLEHLEAFLKGKGETWPIVAHELPASPDKCIAIRKYSGIPGRLKNDDGLPVDDHPRFQILTRSSSDLEAEGKADELHDLLHLRHSSVSNVRVFRMQAEQRPAFMLRDENTRYVYVFNISAWVLR